MLIKVIFILILPLILFLPFRISIKIIFNEDSFFILINNKKIHIQNFLKKENKKPKNKKKTKAIFNSILGAFSSTSFKPNLNFKCNFTYGLDDASNTALFYGFLYSFKGILYNFLSKIFNLKKFELNILPDFNNSIIKFEISSIIFINLAKIILIGVKFFINMQKEKKLWKITQ